MGPYKPLRTWVDEFIPYGNNGSLLQHVMASFEYQSRPLEDCFCNDLAVRQEDALSPTHLCIANPNSALRFAVLGVELYVYRYRTRFAKRFIFYTV